MTFVNCVLEKFVRFWPNPIKHYIYAMSLKTRTDYSKSSNPIGSEIIDNACKKYRELPSRTLARLLFNNPKHKGLWTSVECIRLAVMRRRGRSEKGRGQKDGCVSTAPTVQWNPEKFIPPSDEQKWIPYDFTVDRDCRGLVFGDLHFPYHSVSALKCLLERGRKINPAFIIINGDGLDFYKLSRFHKDPRKRDVVGEIKKANEFLDVLDEMFPKAKKVWKNGNHDERLQHYINAHGAELFDIINEKISLDKLLELEERGWDYVDDQRLIYANELTILHGHEYPTPVIGPVNAARGLFVRAIGCALVNHHHQISEHTSSTIRGKPITTKSIGCLCELNPAYARLNKWSQGFAELELGRRSGFAIHNKRIHNGRLLD